MTDDTGPTPPSERIRSLDALRGFALLGILVINVRVFSMPEAVLLNPTVYGDFTGGDYWVWFLGYVFAQSKFLTIFSALFGAGVLLFFQSKKEKGQPAVRLYVRRTTVLVAIGLLHAYGLWYGDILVTYGMIGFFLLAVRDLAARNLAALGVLFLSLLSLVEISVAVTAGGEAIANQWAPAEATLQREVAAYRGGWLQQMSHRVPTAFQRQTTGFIASSFWRVGGTMLIGMALYRWGVLTGERSPQLYRWLVAAGVAGVAIVVTGVAYIKANDWSADAGLFWRQFNYWGSLLVAGGYVGGITLYARWRSDGLITSGLAAVGRTAFTNYLLQTVVATTVFYGHGLGLFGSVSRIEGMGFVAIVWVVQVVLSVLWLRAFRFGPVEWVWRSLTYGERPPLRA